MVAFSFSNLSDCLLYLKDATRLARARVGKRLAHPLSGVEILAGVITVYVRYIRDRQITNYLYSLPTLIDRYHEGQAL